MTGLWLLGSVLVVLAPLVWIAYNAKQFHDPFDFLRGPYSARAIEARTSPSGAGHYMEYHRPIVAGALLPESGRAGGGGSPCDATDPCHGFGGTAVLWARRRSAGLVSRRCCGCRCHSMSTRWRTGRCRFSFPVWFPHSWYNTRYGMEMLPAFALFGAAALEGLASVAASMGEMDGAGNGSADSGECVVPVAGGPVGLSGGGEEFAHAHSV